MHLEKRVDPSVAKKRLLQGQAGTQPVISESQSEDVPHVDHTEETLDNRVLLRALEEVLEGGGELTPDEQVVPISNEQASVLGELFC